MKNILVLIHDDPGQEARFQAALDLTRAVDGHLICLDVAIMPTLVGDYADAGASALLVEAEHDREDTNILRIQTRLNAEDVPYEWMRASGFLSVIVQDAAETADVIVLNRELSSADYPDMKKTVGELLLHSEKAILAVPEESRGLNLFGSAVLAWDGSAQASAALRAAAPLLARSRDVTIVEIDDGSIKVPAEEAAEYLSRHGAKPAIHRESSAYDIPSTILLDYIVETGASYVVMGGFGHSRLLEAVLGGVTRRMLQESPVPLFLAH